MVGASAFSVGIDSPGLFRHAVLVNVLPFASSYTERGFNCDQTS